VLPDDIVLAGIGTPATAAIGAPIADGVHDPWRNGGQYVPSTFWSSAFYALSWVDGADLPNIGADGVGVIGDGYGWLRPFIVDNVTPTWDEFANTFDVVAFPPSGVPGVYAADGAGSGVLAIYYDGGGATPNTAIDPLDYIGAGFTVIGPYEFPAGTPGEALPGPDGAYYHDETDKTVPVVYGPKAGGDWGAGVAIVGAAPATPYPSIVNVDTGATAHLYTGTLDPVTEWGALDGDVWLDGGVARVLIAGVWTP
jgi:hypothetical protein